MCAPSRAQCANANGPGLGVRSEQRAATYKHVSDPRILAKNVHDYDRRQLRGGAGSETRLMLQTAANKLVAIRDPCIHPSAIAWALLVRICVCIYLSTYVISPCTCIEISKRD